MLIISNKIYIENNTEQPEKYLCKYEIDNEGFVKLGDVTRGLLGRQTQYISRFIDNTDSEYPNFVNSLKFKNVFKEGQEKGSGNYYDYKIHKDSIEEFVKRVKNYYGE